MPLFRMISVFVRVNHICASEHKRARSRRKQACYGRRVIKVDQVSALLEVRGITKCFAGVHALRGVDLDVRPGEVHCVLGQNGAGKSTLIKTLAGVHRPDRGIHRLAGRSRRDPHARSRARTRHRDDVPGARRRRRTHDRREHLPRPRTGARRVHEALGGGPADHASCCVDWDTRICLRTPRSGSSARPTSRSSAWRVRCRTTSS